MRLVHRFFSFWGLINCQTITVTGLRGCFSKKSGWIRTNQSCSQGNKLKLKGSVIQKSPTPLFTIMLMEAPGTFLIHITILESTRKSHSGSVPYINSRENVPIWCCPHAQNTQKSRLTCISPVLMPFPGCPSFFACFYKRHFLNISQ